MGSNQPSVTTDWGDIVHVDHALVRFVTRDGKAIRAPKRRRDAGYIEFLPESYNFGRYGDALPWGTDRATDWNFKMNSAAATVVTWWLVPIEPIIGIVLGWSKLYEGTIHSDDEGPGYMDKRSTVDAVIIGLRPGRTSGPVMLRTTAKGIRPGNLGELLPHIEDGFEVDEGMNVVS